MKPLIVYLDQNKWIELAQVLHRKKQGAAERDTVFHIARLADAGRCVLPLSLGHYEEVYKIGNRDRRLRLAKVMLRFSKGITLADPSVILRHELSVALRQHFSSIPQWSLLLLGKGIRHAI